MTLYIVTRPALNAADAKPPLSINGVAIPYSFGMPPCELDDDAAATLRNTFGFTVTPVEDDTAPEPELTPEPTLDPATTSPASGDGDGAASPDGGAADGSADTDQPLSDAQEFDPDTVIDGTVADVTAKLDGLTLDQLRAVEAAEADREVPRKGVAKAIADAIAATQE